MNIESLLNQMLKTGKELAQKGQAVAEEKLSIPKEGEQRDATLAGLKTGAAAAGVLALLLGTRTGRKVTGAGLKIGSLAALGGVAYQMYKEWEQNQVVNEPALLAAPEQVPVLSGEALLKAMVAAAKADGHVDERELELIRSKFAELKLDADLNDVLMDELINPLGVTEVAALAGGDQKAALEIYLASSLLLDSSNEADRVYLADLQTALDLPDALVAVAKDSGQESHCVTG